MAKGLDDRVRGTHEGGPGSDPAPERVAGVPTGQQAQVGKEEAEDHKKAGAGEGGETITKAKERC